MPSAPSGQPDRECTLLLLTHLFMCVCVCVCMCVVCVCACLCVCMSVCCLCVHTAICNASFDEGLCGGYATEYVNAKITLEEKDNGVEYFQDQTASFHASKQLYPRVCLLGWGAGEITANIIKMLRQIVQ